MVDIDLKTALSTIASLAENTYVWDIITALRGPDFQLSEKLKYATTSVIRYHLLKRAHHFNMQIDFNEDSFNGSIICRDTEEFKNLRLEYGKDDNFNSLSISLKGTEYHHFLFHSYRAFQALGLKWNEVNK